jgi:hypothetical protein
MKNWIRVNKWSGLTLSLIVAQMSGSASAQVQPPAVSAAPQLRLQISPYTHHFNADTNHKNVVLLGVEREFSNGKLDGLALFSNSFGQESAYLYPWGGVYKSLLGVQPLSFKWTAGLLYGYKAPYEDKVPLNSKGFSPGLIFGLAYEFKPGWSAQLNILGTAGLMFGVNVPLK